MLRDRIARRRLVVFGALVATCLVMLMVSNSGPVQRAASRRQLRASRPVQGSLAEGTRSVTGRSWAPSARSRHCAARTSSCATASAARGPGRHLRVDGRGEQAAGRRLLEVRDRIDHRPRWRPASSAARPRSSNASSPSTAAPTSGIRRSDPVLSEGGALAGRISEVGENWASVMLISDTRSLVIGLDSRTRATGEVTGRLSAPLAMTNIPRTDRIEVNDRVVTAGIALGRRFQSAFPTRHRHRRVVDVQASRAPSCRPRSCSPRPTSTASRTSSSSSTSTRRAVRTGRRRGRIGEPEAGAGDAS